MTANIIQTSPDFRGRDRGFEVVGVGGTVDSYLWDFGDGSNSHPTTSSTSHTYARGGVYTATCVVTGSNLDLNQAPTLSLISHVDIRQFYGWLRFNTLDLQSPIFEAFTSPPPGSYFLEDSKGSFHMDMQASKTAGYVTGFSFFPTFFDAVLEIGPDGGNATIMGGADNGQTPGFPWCLARDGIHAYSVNHVNQISTGILGDDIFSNGTVVFDYTTVDPSISSFSQVLTTDRTNGHIIAFTSREDLVLNFGWFIDEIDPTTGTLVHSVQIWDNVTNIGFGGTNADLFHTPYKFLLAADKGIVYFTASGNAFNPGSFGDFYPNDAIWIIRMVTGAGVDHYAFRIGDNLPIVGLEVPGGPEPPLRMRQRNDGLANNGPRVMTPGKNNPTSRQGSIRQGSKNTYL